MNLVRMVSRDGFLEEFWTELRLQRKSNPSISQREVYEILDRAFYGLYEMHRFATYDAFRMFLCRAAKSGK